ncbi:hypothetical protein EYF80_024318 [Liparis tanakae]|uniref:Uncharacterized protein n=1 Tax=Liparis tanakae TaxID=230148 RepID=A0A4Z2HHW2_9TELE|nr:hypothetical protein EYF80_024318 [Liparis tanakae]
MINIRSLSWGEYPPLGATAVRAVTRRARRGPYICCRVAVDGVVCGSVEHHRGSVRMADAPRDTEHRVTGRDEQGELAPLSGNTLNTCRVEAGCHLTEGNL